MWFENDPTIINAALIENRSFNINFSHRFLEPICPSKQSFKRDFLIEKTRSYEIAGIAYHSYRNDLYMTYNYMGDDYYNGMPLDLDYEPWNEYDSDAIAVRMLGKKLGYIRRYDTEDVSNIMTYSRDYSASFQSECPGLEKVEITFLQDFHNELSFPFQADMFLNAKCSPRKYEKYVGFINNCVGHTVSFDESYWNKKIALKTDMNSRIGYIDEPFIANQYLRTPMIGFIKEVITDDESETVEMKLRLLMKKSVINKNYLKSYQALNQHFNLFYDAGTYTISLADLIKVVPRKARTLDAYEPLVKYLKEYHAITLLILD